MAITQSEIEETQKLYDLAMTGDIDAIFKLLDLFTAAIAGDPTSAGLACSITNTIDRSRWGNNTNKQQK